MAILLVSVYPRLVGCLFGLGLTALLTQFKSYRTLKLNIYVNMKDLIEINSWSKVNKKGKKNIYI